MYAMLSMEALVYGADEFLDGSVPRTTKIDHKPFGKIYSLMYGKQDQHNSTEHVGMGKVRTYI